MGESEWLQDEGAFGLDLPGGGDAPAGLVPLDPEAPVPEGTLHAAVVGVLQDVYDPEIPVDIYRLGLIYEIAVHEDARRVDVTMTLTSPSCPTAGWILDEVRFRVRELDGVDDVDVAVVWDPPWTPARMSEGARLELGLD